MESFDFPVVALLPSLQTALQTQTRMVLEAPPGAGKTTQVPLAMREAPWLQGRRIIMLEPRRIAARSAASFIAHQLGEPVGQTVGYRVRFENRVSAQTQIEVVTEGILTRMIQDDPTLEGIGAVILDEFHERHLSADLALALALDVQSQLRPDLRILLMSATLDGAQWAQVLGAAHLSSEGRQFPVHIHYFPARRDESREFQAGRAIQQALAQNPGDILVFLPGWREISRVRAILGRSLDADTAQVEVLHGDLPMEQQMRILQPETGNRRRVILSTNVAESSVTLSGIRTVVDTGLVREARFDPNRGFSRLDVAHISQASADQRAGRAGRVGEGWAYRLWPSSQRLEAESRPEIIRADLAGLALEMAAWGQEKLQFVDAPPAGNLAAARDLLQQLRAISTSHRITDTGRRMLSLGTHPRLAAMLLAAQDRDLALACDLAALLEARDVLADGSDALAERWRVLTAFRRGNLSAGVSRTTLTVVEAAARQWRNRLRCSEPPPETVDSHHLGRCLAHGFPDWIATQHPQDAQRYYLANGRIVRLHEESSLKGEPWLVVTQLHQSNQEMRILRAVPVDPGYLRSAFAKRFISVDLTQWDSDRQALVCVRETRFDRMVLSRMSAGVPDPAQAAAALVEAVREVGLSLLPWTPVLHQWQLRVQSLRYWMPELEIPDVSSSALMETLELWLQPAFTGKTRLDALTAAELERALMSQLNWEHVSFLDRFVPAWVVVPSGRRHQIIYSIDSEGKPQSPVLAVKLQEMFGLADTPRIANEQVALTLHLLSPAGQPLQMTQDLRSFWQRTYPEIKKTMKGRYPKHPWPEDPWTAPATHRTKTSDRGGQRKK